MITQKDIAQKLGVSVRAVGFAINGTGRLSDDLRERIVEESKSLGYRPNPLARALVTGKTGLIAVWVPKMTDPGSAPVSLAEINSSATTYLFLDSGGYKSRPALATSITFLAAVNTA